MGLKEEFFRLLNEDEEFRMAVAGYLGLREVLEELRRLREDFNNFVKEERARWEEANRRFSKLEEELRRLREDFNRLVEEHNNFVKEQRVRWEEANRRFSKLEEWLDALIGAVYTRYVWEDLGEVVRASGERVVRRMRNADLDGVVVDLLVETEGRAYVVDVRIRPRVDDVGALLAKAEAVGHMLGKPAVPVLAGSRIARDVEAYARGKGALVYVY